MKATEEINFPNLRVLEKKGRQGLEEGDSSYFSVKKGEDVVKVLESNGYGEQEVKDYITRIMKGNPHLLSLENEYEKKKQVEAVNERDAERKRKEELFALKKKEQVDKLLELGVDKKHVPALEPDRVNLLYKLEQEGGSDVGR